MLNCFFSIWKKKYKIEKNISCGFTLTYVVRISNEKVCNRQNTIGSAILGLVEIKEFRNKHEFKTMISNFSKNELNHAYQQINQNEHSGQLMPEVF